MAKVKMVKKQTVDVEAEPDVPKSKPVLVTKKAKKAEEPTADKASRFKGLTSGLRVRDFQDKTLKDNTKAKLTDAKLAELWNDEFPNAKQVGEKMVSVVRKLYNAGKHGKLLPAPEKPSVPYDAAGNKIVEK